jgi:hypothetical protein
MKTPPALVSAQTEAFSRQNNQKKMDVLIQISIYIRDFLFIAMIEFAPAALRGSLPTP